MGVNSKMIAEIIIDDAKVKKGIKELEVIMDQLYDKAYQLRKNSQIKVRLTSEEPLKEEEATSGNW